MKTAILSVGTEILFGQIVNTNAAYLSNRLQLLGYDVMYHYTVGDNPKRLKEIIRHIFEDCDLILTTGGLGPTQDDLTKEMVCEAMNDALVENEEEMEKLKAYFTDTARPMPPNNLKQAYLPSRAVVLGNDIGTAPGFALEDEGKMIICMPGPPGEMERMFLNKVQPLLEEKSDGALYYRVIRTIGIGESQLETELLDLIDGQTDPTLATYAKSGESMLRIASKRKTRQEAEAAVDEMLEKVKEKIGAYIYSCDDIELAEVVAQKLIKNNITISAAESCTAGLFSATLADHPGISAVFDRGLVTYSNRAKVEELGVSEETLQTFGAVSEETAAEMATGLRQKTGSDICVSVTGVAGPDGDTDEKPVGLIYIGISYKSKAGDQTKVSKLFTRRPDRNRNRQRSVLGMLDCVNKAIDEIIQ